MRIAYLANIRLPTEKAHGIQIMKMCEAFALLGHEVTLVVPKRANHLTVEPFTYYGIRPLFSIRRVSCLDGIRFWGTVGFGLQTLFFTLAARREILRLKPECLYTRDAEVVAFLGSMGKKVIWEMHTEHINFLSRSAMRRAIAIIAVTSGLKELVVSYGISASKIHVEHDAVDLQEFSVEEEKAALREKLSLPLNRSILEYVGKFHTMGSPKGVEELIQAAGILAQTHPHIFLLLVGLESQDMPKAIHAAHAAGLRGDQYQFVGHVSRKLVAEYLHAADILLMNYPNLPHYARMMSPLKVFEYMASGVPIVTSDLPSLREVLTDTDAQFVVPDDIPAFARGVRDLLDHPEKAAQLAKRAYDKAAYYSWKGRAERILAHCHEKN